MTTSVVPWTSFRLGQVVRLSSTITSERNCRTFRNQSFMALRPSSKFPDAGSHALAGQEGLEPPTSGFGDRRSSHSSYWPVGEAIPASLRFLVQGVVPAVAAKLLHFEL